MLGPPRSPMPRRLLLRTALASGAAAVAFTGCDSVPTPRSGSRGSAQTNPAQTNPAQTNPAQSPSGGVDGGDGGDGGDGVNGVDGVDGGTENADVAVLAEIQQEVAATLALLAATRARHRDVRADLQVMSRLHRRQASVLADSGPAPTTPVPATTPAPTTAPPRIPAREPVALAAVLAAEKSLRSRLDRAVAEVRSGPFARLLASMSAGTAQLLATAPAAGSVSYPTGTVGPDAVQALQRTLAAEHAAAYVFAVLGGRTSAGSVPELYEAVERAYAAHLDQRDHLTAALLGLGVDPEPAQVAYELPLPAESTPQIVGAALETERRCAATYADLVAHLDASRRGWATHALSSAAVRQLSFGATPAPFPGLDELADRSPAG